MEEIEETFGKIQILESTKEFGSSILIINPGKEISRHHHKKMKEVEIILEGRPLYLADNLIHSKGDINVWKPYQVHGYKNISSSITRILCITVPPYDPKDVFED